MADLQRTYAEEINAAKQDIASWQALLYAMQKQLERYAPDHPLITDKALRRRIGDVGVTAYRLAPEGRGFEAAREAGATFKIPGEPTVFGTYAEEQKKLSEVLSGLVAHQGELQRISLAKRLSGRFSAEFQEAMGLVEKRILQGECYSDPTYNTRRVVTTWDGLPEAMRPSGALFERGRQNYMRWWYARGGYLKPLDSSPTQTAVPQAAVTPIKVPLGPSARAVTSAQEDNAALLKELAGAPKVAFGPNASFAHGQEKQVQPPQ